MTQDEILQNIMPCGCVCHTCLGCGNGVIATHAKEMLHYLDGYDDFLKNHPDYQIVHDAIRTLRFWSQQDCPGCRVDGENLCQYKDCMVRDCSKKLRVDFCYLCESYPCEIINTNAKWREASDYMLKFGVAAFYECEKQLSHYRHFKENIDLSNK